MSFVLTIDTQRWRAHQDQVHTSLSQVPITPVPVAKGNGYGVGNLRLVAESVRLGAPAIAVGTIHELPAVLAHDEGRAANMDVLVLEPVTFRAEVAGEAWAALADHPQLSRVIHTVASIQAATDLVNSATTNAPRRVLLEGLTSMLRFGLTEDELASALTVLAPGIASGAIKLEGLALHLPLATPEQPRVGSIGMLQAADTPTGNPVVVGSARVHEVVAWGLLWPSLLGHLGGQDDAGALWLSHLTEAECTDVARALPDLPLRLRIGSRLWLGAKGALQARATVLAVHPVPEGQAAGYHQRRGPRGGHIVVVSGGTSHGVALVAPRPGVSARQRVAAASVGALEAAGRLRSPFVLPSGGHAWFLEPPHMHVSMLRIPRGTIPPPVGELIDCDVRLTTVLPDAIIG